LVGTRCTPGDDGSEELNPAGESVLASGYFRSGLWLHPWRARGIGFIDDGYTSLSKTLDATFC
jgi:hypothetical protein